MGDKRVYVRELKEYFKLKQVTGNEESLDRWIITPDINRPGLELTGFNEAIDLKRVILIGKKETYYINKLDYETKRERFHIITDSFTPCIIITNGEKIDNALFDVANEKNFPVFETDSLTYRSIVEICAFLDDKLAPTGSYHGVLMNIYGLGVMLIGDSGVGKSELALELIKKGHILVADDRVEIKKIHNELYGESHKILKNFLEIRGIGIIDVPLMFGASSVLDKVKISLVINLKKKEFFTEDRIGINGFKTMNIMGVEMNTMEIPVKEGRAMSVMIETAVSHFRLFEQGYNIAELFNQQTIEYIKENERGDD